MSATTSLLCVREVVAAPELAFLIRTQVDRHGGELAAADLVAFASARAALDCASALLDSTASARAAGSPAQIAIAIHTGEEGVEEAVRSYARHAGPGEALASSVTRALAGAARFGPTRLVAEGAQLVELYPLGSAVAEDAGLLQRDEELGLLDASLARLLSGSGGCVVLEGPAGAGKSTLLDALRERARAANVTVLSARGTESESALPFGLVNRLVEPFSEPLPGRDSATLPDEAVPGAVGRQLVSLLPETCVLVIDDVQWADDASRRVIEYLALGAADGRCLVALGLRRGAGSPIAVGSDARWITPAPLREPAIEVLARRVLGADPEGTFVSACARVTEGNPFLLAASLHEVAASGLKPDAAGAGAIAKLAPSALARAVLPRVATLGPEAVALSTAVAMCPPGTPVRHLAALADLPTPAASAVADRLAQAGVLGAGRPLDFAHPLMRQAVRDSVPAGRRANLHRRAAALLQDEGADPGAMAAHLLHVEPDGDAGVVDALTAAADAAVAVGARREAVELLERALVEPPPPERRQAVALALGEQLVRLADPGAVALLERVHAAAREQEQRLETAHALAVALDQAERTDEALALLRETLAPLELTDPRGHALRARLLVILVRRWEGVEEMDAHKPLLAHLTGRTPEERLLLGVMAHFDYPSAEEGLAVCRTFARRVLGDTDNEIGIGMAAFPLWEGFDEGRAVAGQWIEHHPELAGTTTWAHVAAVSMRLQLVCGDARAAELAGTDAFDTLRHGSAMSRQVTGAKLAPILVARDRLDSAAALLAELGEPHGSTEFRLHEAWAELHAAAGAFARAAEALEPVLSSGDTHPSAVPQRQLWARFAARAGRIQAAAEVAGQDAESASRLGLKAAEGRALHALACCVADADEQVLAFDRAVRCLAGTQDRHAHLRAQFDLGCALRRAGRRREAREVLGDALARAERGGFELLKRAIGDELAAAGARRGAGRSATGPESLTPSELRIARLVAEGRTNREVAEALSLSVKTVEMHLRGAFRKLDIASRAELEDVLVS